ncbi:hypothetical protein K457DRAFT_335295 [Linnemannia elongata AG-77]|uniref:Uncharacterized protein n=1 Tax=Linnemannia elongata AG-77 TaxID=1314771 RepID=A0A197JB47_9FUNG|nr:hypothetical protein K457DRAFT_335295 [Linnemannia elongata AG-77]
MLDCHKPVIRAKKVGIVAMKKNRSGGKDKKEREGWQISFYFHSTLLFTSPTLLIITHYSLLLTLITTPTPFAITHSHSLKPSA